LGLGLPTARRIAELHGGRLEMESSGEGTTARLVLPTALSVRAYGT
jgi:signal transduction histidine kinase